MHSLLKAQGTNFFDYTLKPSKEIGLSRIATRKKADIPKTIEKMPYPLNGSCRDDASTHNIDMQESKKLIELPYAYWNI